MLFSNCEASNNRVVALESKVDSLEKLTAEQKKDIAEYKNAVEEKEQRIAYLNERIHRRNRTIDELTDAAAQQKLSIKDLTGAILRSTNIGTTTRGDDYFGGEFASLAGATRHWALRHFRGAPDVSYRDLPPVVHELLKPVFFEYDPTSDKKVSYKVIEAAAIQRISQNIFCSNFIFAIHRQPYPSVSKLLGGAGKPTAVCKGLNIRITDMKKPDIQKRKWHSQTIELVLQGDQFDACFGKGVDTVVEDLYSCFGGLAKAGSQEQCLKALRAVVEQAAKLEVEVCRQISVFKLKSITPGSEYDPSLMEDQSGLVDDAGEEGEDGQGFIVQLVYFPPVIRFQLDDAGNISESFVVVRKGTVVAAPKAEES